jgi:hypothetical protein
MKLTKKQISQIRQITHLSRRTFHGNRKWVGDLPIDLYLKIVEKKWDRLKAKREHKETSIYETVRRLLNWSKECAGTPYFKILIEGNTGIYYASPYYGHSDYNKHRVFDKNEQTLKIMKLFNAIVSRFPPAAGEAE